MVSFIEIEQYQGWIMKNIIRNSKTTEVNHIPLNIVKLFDISPDIRQSAFLEQVADDDVVENTKLIAFKLYKKYIEVGSELEINISALLRNELKDILSDKERLMNNININLNELLLLFEKSKDEMRLLLNYSLDRFKQKAEYMEIIEIMHKLSSSKFRRLSLSIANNI